MRLGYAKVIEIAKIAKYVIKNPKTALRYGSSYIRSKLKFGTKTESSVQFFKYYLNYDYSWVIRQLKEYWKRYRFFDEISKEVKAGMKILDVGGGGTSVLNLLQNNNLELYCVDPIISCLKRENFPMSNKINWITGRGENLMFKDNTFDIIFCTNVLDHVEDPKSTLSEIYRVLKLHGKLILTVDVFDFKIKRDKEHPHTFVEKDVYELIQQFGFAVLFKKYTIGAQFSNFLKGIVDKNLPKRELCLILRKEVKR